MSTLLVTRAAQIMAMDDAGSRWAEGAIYVVDNIVRQIGPASELPTAADVVIDASGMLVMPGLVNTHHHFYQTLTRNLPQAQNANLFDWLVAHYQVWAGLTPEAVRVSTRIALAELMLSGCTTTSDHTYVWPNGARLDDQIEAAVEMGVRFHAARGSMSVGESQGGLPPTAWWRTRRPSCATAAG
jgi:cytosine/adenosine deaminase-related metal-dependent hydrolase